jgi:hypothetical protein
MNADNTQVTDRIALARIRMKRQVEAATIQGEISDWIRESQDPSVVRCISELQYSHPDVYAYIQQLERINTSIWCPKCENLKFVPGWHETPQVDSELCDTYVRNIQRKMRQAASSIEMLADTFDEHSLSIREYLAGAKADADSVSELLSQPTDSGADSKQTRSSRMPVPSTAQSPRQHAPGLPRNFTPAPARPGQNSAESHHANTGRHGSKNNIAVRRRSPEPRRPASSMSHFSGRVLPEWEGRGSTALGQSGRQPPAANGQPARAADSRDTYARIPPQYAQEYEPLVAIYGDDTRSRPSDSAYGDVDSDSDGMRDRRQYNSRDGDGTRDATRDQRQYDGGGNGTRDQRQQGGNGNADTRDRDSRRDGDSGNTREYIRRFAANASPKRQLARSSIFDSPYARQSPQYTPEYNPVSAVESNTDVTPKLVDNIDSVQTPQPVSTATATLNEIFGNIVDYDDSMY